jgi:hypothetical protein
MVGMRRFKEKVTIRLDVEAHRIAREAALRAKMTLSEWCEKAVGAMAWDELRERHREECAIRRALGRSDTPP